MSLEPGTIEFPNNVIELLAIRAKQYVDPDLFIAKRPLRTSDHGQSVGIFPSLKVPDQSSWEVGGAGSQASGEPTLKRYTVILQSYVKDSNEERAISIHSILAARLWRMVFWDNPLHVGLTALQVVANNTTERFQRRGVSLARYLSNEIQGSFIQTSWIEFWFDTETTRS